MYNNWSKPLNNVDVFFLYLPVISENETLLARRSMTRQCMLKSNLK